MPIRQHSTSVSAIDTHTIVRAHKRPCVQHASPRGRVQRVCFIDRAHTQISMREKRYGMRVGT